jgi:hypothetical protein
MERAELVRRNGTLGRFLDGLDGNGPGEPRVRREERMAGRTARTHERALSSVFLSGMISR